MDAVKTLSPSNNKVVVAGTLKELKLEQKTGQKGEYISGYALIQTSDTNVCRVDFYANKMTKDNKESGVYKGLMTARSSYTTLADCADRGMPVTEATHVVVTNGNLGLNEYYDEAGVLKSNWKVSSSFLSSNTRGLPAQSKFEVTGLISAIKPATEKLAPRVELIVPIYGGNVIPLTLDLPEDAFDSFESMYSRGDTANLWGTIMNRTIVNKVTKSGFGEARTDETVTYERSLMLEGGEPPYDEDDANVIDKSAVREALSARETFLEELKEKAKSKGNSFNSPARGNTTPKSTEEFNW